MGEGECYCWCGKRMRFMCASSAPQGAGTCDVEGCGGRVEVEEMVYVCTEHNEYACRECVPRAARLIVDALLDECAMVEQEIEQFRQELGLNVMESGDEAPQALHHAMLLGDVVESGDEAPQALHHAVPLEDGELTAGLDDGEGGMEGGIDDNFDGPERDVSVVQLRQKGLAAASWVGGRRRATRKEVDLGGRECRWQGKDHQRLRMQKRERGDDTVSDHGDRSLRSRTGEAALVAAGIGAGGESLDEVTYENKEYASRKSFRRTDKRTHRNICDTTAVKRKRQFEEGKNGRKTAMDVREKEKRQPQVSRDSQESRDHCGSKRRRVQEERGGDCM
jgi:hypothetical protein